MVKRSFSEHSDDLEVEHSFSIHGGNLSFIIHGGDLVVKRLEFH